MKPFPARSIFPLVTLFSLGISLVSGAHGAMSSGFNQLLDAVVSINVRELSFEGGSRRYTAAIGSGVILSEDGLVLTNAHVVSPQAVEINITLSNLERVSAKLVGWDHWTDLAVVRIDMDEALRRGWKRTHAEFGKSQDLYTGQVVYAVGTPHGLTRTVSRGIVSNRDRYFEDSRAVRGYETGAFNTWLQTDAAINPGNSGGPLVTEDGKVVGISSRGYLGANNLGFAIPASTAKDVMERLVKDGAITRSYVGIVPSPLQDLENFYSLESRIGMLINNVETGSPAAKAGLRTGDIVLSIDGVKVDGRFPEQLPPIQNMIASQRVGSTLKFIVKRGTDTREFDVVTEKLESRVGEEWAFEKWGLSVRKVSRAFARESMLDDDTGVIVIGVQPGFPADVAGLSRGDVITKVNQQSIGSLETLKTLYAAYEAKPGPTLIEAQRGPRRVALYVLKP